MNAVPNTPVIEGLSLQVVAQGIESHYPGAMQPRGPLGAFACSLLDPYGRLTILERSPKTSDPRHQEGSAYHPRILLTTYRSNEQGDGFQEVVISQACGLQDGHMTVDALEGLGRQENRYVWSRRNLVDQRLGKDRLCRRVTDYALGLHVLSNRTREPVDQLLMSPDWPLYVFIAQRLGKALIESNHPQIFSADLSADLLRSFTPSD